MVASLPWRRGPQIQEPWHHKSHRAVDVVGPMTPPGRASGRGDAGVYTDRRKVPHGAILGHSCTLLRRCGQVRERRSVHKSTKSASRRRFGAFVYTVATLVATRAASGGTSASTTMTCRRHSLGSHLPLGRKNRLCTSGAAARLASSPRQHNPHKPPKSHGRQWGPLLTGNNASSRLLGRQGIKGIIDAHYQTASHPWSQGVQAATCP